MADQDNQLTPPLADSSLENYTGSELPYKMLYISGIALAVTAVVFALALVPMRDAMIKSADERNAGAIIPSSERAARARLQQDPESVWQAHEAVMADQTSTFGWHDQPHGIVRVPVARALEMILAEGAIASTPDATVAVLHGTLSHASGGDHEGADHGGTEHGGTGPEEDAETEDEAAH